MLAGWSYNLLQVTPEIDAVVNHFYNEVVGPFGPPERRLIERGYGELPFPFQELQAPPFRMLAQWSLPALLGLFANLVRRTTIHSGKGSRSGRAD